METEGRWTLDELVQLVGDALTRDRYPGAPNGRVRDLPDRRAVRWYATIGLVDRPVAVRGRAARYGPRHLWQLLAVKRRQAEGRTLAEIQAELAGATDTALRRVAAVPDAWPAPAPTDGAAADGMQPARTRFWATPPTAATPTVGSTASAPVGTSVLTGIPLGAGAILLVPARTDGADVPAIQAAARPLLALLADRGLIPSDPDRSPT